MSLIDIKSNLSTYRFPYKTKSVLTHSTQNSATITTKKDSPTGVNGFIENITKTHIKGYKGSKYNDTTKLYNSLNLPFKHTLKNGRKVNTIFKHTIKEGRDVNTIFKHTPKRSNFIPQQIKIPIKTGRNVNTIFNHTTKEGRDVNVNTIFKHTPKRSNFIPQQINIPTKTGRDVNTTFNHTAKDGRDVNTTFNHTAKDGRDVNTTFNHTAKDGRDVNTTFNHTAKDGRDVNTIFDHTAKDGRDVNTIFDHTAKDGRDVNTIFNHTVKDGRDVNGLQHTILANDNKDNDLLAYVNNQYIIFNDRYSLEDTAYKKSASLYSPPFCVRGIQRKGKESNTNDLRYEDGVGGLRNSLSKLAGKTGKILQSAFNEISNLNGITTYTTAAFEDAIRLAKWNLSTQGIVFNIKNQALALMNPKIEGISNLNRIKVGAMMIANATLAKVGIFAPDYGISTLLQENGKYSHAYNNSKNIFSSSSHNEYGLYNLYKTQEYNKFIWSSLSGIGGPDSFFGIGTTIISRYYNSNNNKFYNKDGSEITSSFSADTPYNNDDNDDNKLYIKKNDIKTSTTTEFTTSLFDEADIRTKRTDLSKNYYSDTNNDRSNTYSALYKDGYAQGNIKHNDDKLNNYNGKTLEGWFGYPSTNTGIGTQIGVSSFLEEGNHFGNSSPFILSQNSDFSGDKINAIDTGNFIGHDWDFGEDNNVYNNSSDSSNTKYRDLISFYFMDGDLYSNANNLYERRAKSVLVFRAFISSFDEQYNPRWDSINIMGRPDPAYIYKGVTRNINFTFMVAASSRSEMIPMWRKLNYLASYTAPKYTSAEKRMVGPFMRLTLGDLFRQTPIILTSLRYNIQENYPWDIALDKDLTNDAKQLPQVINVQCTANIISDYRPQFGGRFYSLSFGGGTNTKAGNNNTIYSAGDTTGQWLSDSTSESTVITGTNTNNTDTKNRDTFSDKAKIAYNQSPENNG